MNETDSTTPPNQGPAASNQPTVASDRKDHHPSTWHELISIIGVLAAALIVALLMIAFVFQSYAVDGQSMENTLQNHDRLIVWKVPRTEARITSHPYVPDRGNVIVFNENLSDFGQGTSKQLIKRVIGLPGDRVVVKSGRVTIYNQSHPNGFDPDRTLPYGKDIPSTPGNIDLTLGKNQLFVCGDNRPDSLDSRSFGPISANQVVGKLVLRIFPLSGAKTF